MLTFFEPFEDSRRRRKNMRIPGYSAEASLYKSRQCYLMKFGGTLAVGEGDVSLALGIKSGPSPSTAENVCGECKPKGWKGWWFWRWAWIYNGEQTCCDVDKHGSLNPLDWTYYTDTCVTLSCTTGAASAPSGDHSGLLQLRLKVG